MDSASSDASGFTFNPGMDALHTPFRKTTTEAAAVGLLDTPGSPLVFQRTPEDLDRFEAWRNAIEAVTPSTPGTPAWLGTPGSVPDSGASSSHFARWIRTVNRCSQTPMSNSATPAAAAAAVAGDAVPGSPSLISPKGTSDAVAAGAMRSPLQQMQAPRTSSCLKPSSSTAKGVGSSTQPQHSAAATRNAGSNENSDPADLLTPLRGLNLGAAAAHTPAVAPAAQQRGTPGWRSRLAVGGISDAPTPASPMQQAIDLMLAPQQLDEADTDLEGGSLSPVAATPSSVARRRSLEAPECTAATPAAGSSRATPSRAALTPEQKAIRLMLQPCHITASSSSAASAAAGQQQGSDAQDDLEVVSEAASSDVDSAAADGEVSEDDIDAQELLEMCGPSSMGASGVAEVLEFVLCTPGGGRPAGSAGQATPALGGAGTGEEVCGDVEPRVLFADHGDE